jgi:hypothetical protein
MQNEKCKTQSVRLRLLFRQHITSVMDIGTVVDLNAARSQIMGGIVPLCLRRSPTPPANATGRRVRQFHPPRKNYRPWVRIYP